MLNKLLQILRQISEIIAGNKDYSVVLNQIVKVLSSSLNVNVCSVYIYDENSDELVLAATEGLSKESVGSVKMKSGVGISGACFKQRRVFNVSHPEEHPRFLLFKESGEEKYQSLLAVPLTVGGRCVGTLTIQRVSDERFPAAVIDMVTSLSTQLANLILNAKMLKNLSIDDKGKKAKSRKANKPSGQAMLRGTAANNGVAIGKAFIFESNDLFHAIFHETCKNTGKELKIFDQAIKLAKTKTVELEERALSMISEADASIFYVHLLFLEDPALMNGIRKEITGNGHTAEFSVKMIYMEYCKRFRHLGEDFFRDRVMDLKDVLLRLIESIKVIKGGRTKLRNFESLKRNQILVAEELLPSDLIRMPINNISGIVCEKGGVTAHMAILAKALDIPALLGVRTLIKTTNEGDDIILDCNAETIYIRPDKQATTHFEEMFKAGKHSKKAPDLAPAITLDNREIMLRGNISLVCETSLLKQYGAQGIGLYRTEFLFMIRDYLPSEEDQYKVFSQIVKEAGNHEVTIRVLDTGGDKPLPYINFEKEDNPALGLRGIRLLLARPDIFKTQLRAILRSGKTGNLRILFPMITSETEIISIRQILQEVETELHISKIEHAENYKIGVMLEVPSAVFALESMIDDIDYMSIGSNDLFQYTFAADRGNETISDSFQSMHPVFLGVLKKIGDFFKTQKNKRLALCGEMAGNPLAAPFLIGAGIYDLSMPPRQIPSVKKVIRLFSTEECENMLKEALTYNNPEAVNCLIKNALFQKGMTTAQ